MPESKHEKIKILLDGLFDTYPRYSRLPSEAMAIWCLHLESFPLKSLKVAAFTWSREKPWPPDSFSKFVAAVPTKKQVTEPEPPGFEEFVQEYRSKGLSMSTTPEGHDESDSPKTSSRDVRVHMSIIKDILDKKTRCPRSIANHDIFAKGDAEERWYWGIFERRKRAGR